MPTEKVSMRKIKEVLRLNYEQVGNREIARRLNISAGSVSNYLARAKAAQLIWPLNDEWSEDKVYSVGVLAGNRRNFRTIFGHNRFFRTEGK